MIEVITFEGGLSVDGPKWDEVAALELQYGWRPLEPGIHLLDNEREEMIVTNRLLVTGDGRGRLTTPENLHFTHLVGSEVRAKNQRTQVTIDADQRVCAVANIMGSELAINRLSIVLWPSHVFSIVRLTGLIRYQPNEPLANS